MKAKLTVINTLLLVIAVTIISVLGFLYGRRTFEEETVHSLYLLTDAYASSFIYQRDNGPYQQGATYDVDVASPDVHLRYIDSSGEVIFDSNSQSNIANQLETTEIQNALNGNPNQEIVTSTSLSGVQVLSYAVMVEYTYTERGQQGGGNGGGQVTTVTDHIFVWVGLTASSIQGYLASTIPVYILVGVLLVAVCVIVSIYFSRQALVPLKIVGNSLSSINEGHYIPPDTSHMDKATKELVDHLSLIANSLNTTVSSLEEEKMRRALILENISDGLIVFQKDGTIILFNKRAKQIFDLDDEIIGKNLSVLLSNEFYKENIGKEKALFDFEKDGQIYLCSLTSTDEMCLLVLTDVTSQRQVAEQRREFFDSASHELKTPLTSIQGFSELISLASDDEKVKQYCSVISREASRMMSLVQDMLALSLLEKKDGDQYESISLKTIAIEVKERLTTLIKEKNITVSLSGDAKVKMDPKDATTLFKNLMENAIKYNHPGGNVSLRIDKKGFSVTDDGIGIPAKDLPYIYDRFYRVDKSRSKEMGGTGLGLSIVRNLCANYGFSIECESKVGKGSKFTVIFAKASIEKD